MRLIGFRIINFKSILDSGFRNLSPDNITGFIGQNESGKTSILEALEVFSSKRMYKNQFRIYCNSSTIYCKYQINNKDIFNNLEQQQYLLPLKFQEAFRNGEFNEITLKITFTIINNNVTTSNYELYEKDPIYSYFEGLTIENLLELANKFLEVATNKDIKEEIKHKFIKNPNNLLPSFIQNLPIIKFINNATVLPETIFIKDLSNNTQEADIVKDFLKITNIKLDRLMQYQNNFLEMKNEKEKELKRFWKDLNIIWKQYLGEDRFIPKIDFDIITYNPSNTEIQISPINKPGDIYLKFSIEDKNGHFQISQRSLGFKLYLSIFIALKAAQVENKNIVLLLDEPGVNLHPNGQRSLLKLFEQLKSNIDIIYTTHSSFLIDINHVYRILTVENIENENEEHITKIEKYNTLGNTSYDTLLPLYNSIGMNISHQEVIKKNRNLLIEEISAFYYIKVFWELLYQDKELNILPLSGASKTLDISLLLIGWGLDHTILVDGDNEGKKVIKKLNDKKIYPKERLLTIDYEGIEEMFEKNDFEQYIILDSISKDVSINQFMSENKNKYSKAIISRDFYVKYKNNQLEKEMFSEYTLNNFKNLCNLIDKSFETNFIIN